RRVAAPVQVGIGAHDRPPERDRLVEDVVHGLHAAVPRMLEERVAPDSPREDGHAVDRQPAGTVPPDHAALEGSLVARTRVHGLGRRGVAPRAPHERERARKDDPATRRRHGGSSEAGSYPGGVSGPSPGGASPDRTASTSSMSGSRSLTTTSPRS